MSEKTQVGGDHYLRMKIQPRDVIKANGMTDFDCISALKYVMRFEMTQSLKDLQKARHFIDMAISEREESKQPEQHAAEEKTVPEEFKITGPGVYETRDGGEAHVICRTKDASRMWAGIIPGRKCCGYWTRSGLRRGGKENDTDLVRYLRPLPENAGGEQ